MSQLVSPSDWADLLVSRRNLYRTSRFSVKCRDTDQEYMVDSKALEEWMKKRYRENSPHDDSIRLTRNPQIAIVENGEEQKRRVAAG